MSCSVIGKVKDKKILFEEIIEKNRGYSNIYNIKNIFQQINSYYEKNLKSTPKETIEKKIKELKPKILKNPDEEKLYIELISIMIKANEIIFNYKPREIQIIAVLFFLFKEKNSGLIEEIYTGEGKTIIISFLAIIKAFQGKKIDILTSSLILAERDANEMKNFYNLFGLSVDYCRQNIRENYSDHFENKKKEKECYDCYKADIVYGDTLSFEGDILRTNFMGNVGRGKKRNFDCIIIDEIDNICIDNIKNITELLDNFHGYKFLEYIYLFIYNELKKLDNEIRKKIGNDKMKYELSILSSKKEIIDVIKKKSMEELSDIKLLADKKKIFLPEHLKTFINNRIEKWCESAYEAMYIYKENKEYIISMDEAYGFKIIKPVDFSNTGVIQENSVWTGLHQFLQIKEGLRFTEESLNSCYMSNLSFFKKYISPNENNIYGLTGTLGSKKTQEALKILYKLDLLFIPTFKESKLIIEKPIIEKEPDKYTEIVINKIREYSIDKGRAVLVIFKYIQEVYEMYDLLIKNNLPKQNIINYYINDINDEKKFLQKEIEPGLIILSTNLSGRGTDIKINKELEKRNGLHVILTFLPNSERIERQAFGRAGRKGENGSGQLIILSSESYEELINERNKNEENQFEFLIKVYRKKIDLFQELFEYFSDYLCEIRNKKKIDEYKLLDIKERWGLFLVQNELSKIEKEYKGESSLKINEQMLQKTKNNFTQFMNELKENVNSNYKFLNPLLLCKTFRKERCDEAITKSPILTIGAYCFRCYYNIHKKIDKYKKFVYTDFKSLKNNCTNILNQLKIYVTLMKELDIKENSDLYQQTQEKIKFMNELLDLIKKNLIVCENSLKPIQGKKIDLIPKIISLKEIKDQKHFNDDILDYFRDYGMCLYSLSTEEKNDDCCIF